MQIIGNNLYISIMDGHTRLALIDFDSICDNKDETVDEAMLRAARAMQLQLHTSGLNDNLIHDVLVSAIPAMSDRIHSIKSSSNGYRDMKYTLNMKDTL